MEIGMTVEELRLNNLYQNGYIVQFEDGSQLMLRDNIEYAGGLTDDYHLVRDTDRLDKLAWTYYKDIVPDASKYWWVIADANFIVHPLDIAEFIGKEILIPNINKALLSI